MPTPLRTPGPPVPRFLDPCEARRITPRPQAPARRLLHWALVLLGLGFGFGLAAPAHAAPAAVSAGVGVAPPVQTSSSPAAQALAAHLSKIGARLYAAYWCPHCQAQKELFGREAVARLAVIECADDGQNNRRELCQRKRIEGYPSWEINGRIEAGVQSLQKLADWSGYQGSRAF